ncbi:MAG: hypothetical protein ACJAVZ_000482 [Afipia broomeae]|jgi:hypothetical protein|nr:MAG: hypothetical protein EKK35_09115 [Bradyrhizobiaceae bacterium]
MADTQSSVNDHERHFLQRIILGGFIAVLLDPDVRRKRDNRQLALPGSRAQNAARTIDLLGNVMKIFIVALVFAGISAAAVSMLLNKFQEPGYVAFTTSGARVGDPGHNLIGPS